MLPMIPDEVSAYINTAQTRSLTNIHSCATKLALHKAAQEYIKDLNIGRYVNFIRPAQKRRESGVSGLYPMKIIMKIQAVQSTLLTPLNHAPERVSL